MIDIELALSRANFSTWFKNTSLVKIDEGVALMGVPNDFVKDWLRTKYHSFILERLRNIDPAIRNVEYSILSQKRDTADREEININKRLPLQETNREDGLNQKYSFDNFIVGQFNELAHVSAQAVIKNPGASYNPFFIYGGTGLGKTHIIQAIGNSIKKSFPDKRVYYTSIEKYVLDFTNAIGVNKVNSFKERYRRYDTIIIDDIQFISGKEKTQEELFHLFNTLYDNNKQIIFSSDRHPNLILGLEDRLRSRFGAGMVVDVSQPEYESRLAILRSKTQEYQPYITDELLEFIAETIQGNIRELEGLLTSIICQAQIKGRSLLKEEVKNIIKNNVRSRKNTSIKDVIKTIAEYYSMEEGLIYNKTRQKNVVKPRQVAMYVLREDFDISFPTIGEKLGGRDHTTVIHSCEKIKKDLKVDPILLKEIEEIRAIFK